MRLPPDVLALRKRDGDQCWLCGCIIDFSVRDRKNPKVWSRDHVIPRSWGGPDSLGNLRLAHQRCNESRGCKSPRRVRRAPPGGSREFESFSAAGGRRPGQSLVLGGEEPTLPCM